MEFRRQIALKCFSNLRNLYSTRLQYVDRKLALSGCSWKARDVEQDETIPEHLRVGLHNYLHANRTSQGEPSDSDESDEENVVSRRRPDYRISSIVNEIADTFLRRKRAARITFYIEDLCDFMPMTQVDRTLVEAAPAFEQFVHALEREHLPHEQRESEAYHAATLVLNQVQEENDIRSAAMLSLQQAWKPSPSGTDIERFVDRGLTWAFKKKLFSRGKCYRSRLIRAQNAGEQYVRSMKGINAFVSTASGYMLYPMLKDRYYQN